MVEGRIVGRYTREKSCFLLLNFNSVHIVGPILNKYFHKNFIKCMCARFKKTSHADRQESRGEVFVGMEEKVI